MNQNESTIEILMACGQTREQAIEQLATWDAEDKRKNQDKVLLALQFLTKSGYIVSGANWVNPDGTPIMAIELLVNFMDYEG